MDGFSLGILLFFLGLAAASLVAMTSLYWRKQKISTGVQIQCSSGDSEVMSFSVNFFEDDSFEDKNWKLREAFDFIERRREQNHLKWLEAREKALEEKAKEKEPGEHYPDALPDDEHPQRMVQ